MAEQKFHINSDTNTVGKCSAKVRCRFGGDSGMENHFETQEEAQRQVEKRFEKKFDTLAGTKKSTQNSSDELLKSLSKLKEEERLLEDKNAKLRESIEAELKKNVSLIEKKKAKREKLISDMLDKEGMNALLDVDKAKIVYDTHWSNGRGSRTISNKIDEVFKDVPYSLQHIANHLTTRDYSQAVSQLRIGIPKGAESGKLDKLRDSIVDVFHIQREIMKDTDVEVTIDVFDDSLSQYGDSYAISYDEDDRTYELINRGHSATNKRHRDLKDVFVEVEKYASYGATDEYEKENPNWDKKDDDDDYRW